jgi:hypothetical protein
MKIYERDGKFNFVDENNVFVGYDNSQQCCEEFGWVVSDKVLKKYDDILLAKKAEHYNIEDYSFDPAYFVRIDNNDGDGILAFLLVNGDDRLFLHLYNFQNSHYYDHGFDFSSDRQTIRGTL